MEKKKNAGAHQEYTYLMTTTPWGERCAQISDPQYLNNALLEARAYIQQLKRTYGQNPPGTYFKLVRCSHDFGTYRDVRFYYDEQQQAHLHYLAQLESGCEHWDELSLLELKQNGYCLPPNAPIVQSQFSSSW